eukprot:1559285-Prymnesium_polylepis.2
MVVKPTEGGLPVEAHRPGARMTHHLWAGASRRTCSDNFGGEWHCLRMGARWMSLRTPGPFRPFTHVRSALQVSERRNELH